MKKYQKYLGFMLLAGLVFSFSVVKAEDLNTGVKADHQDFKENIEVKRDAMRTDMQALREQHKNNQEAFTADLKVKRDAFLAELKTKKEEWKKSNSEMKGKFCEGTKEMFAHRFEVATSMLENYQTKVADAIVKLQADGKDTTEATADLDLSKQKLTDAKAKLASIKDIIPADCSNVTSDEFEKVKSGAREAKDLLKESREALHNAVQEITALKGSGNENNDNAN